MYSTTINSTPYNMKYLPQLQKKNENSQQLSIEAQTTEEKID